MAIVNSKKNGDDNANTLVNDKKGYTYMSGLRGNDTYVIENISRSFTEIDDSNGLDLDESPNCEVNVNGIPMPNPSYGYDTVQVKNIKASDLTLFFDVSLAPDKEASAPSDELYIVRKSAISSVVNQVLNMSKAAPQSGAVCISHQFGDTNNGGSQMSASAIENIQVVDTKTGITKTINATEYVDAIKEEIVKLLQEVKGLGLKNNNNEPILSAFQLINSKHTKYKNKLFNIYKNEEMELFYRGTSGTNKFVGEKAINVYTFKEGDGHDIVVSSKGKDSLVFEGVNLDNLTFSAQKNDLIIKYGANDSVAITNYFRLKGKTSIANIYTDDQPSGIDLNSTVELAGININGVNGKRNNLKGTFVADKITGGNLNDTLYGNDGQDTIYGNDGNDIINGGNNDDNLYGGNGDDIIKGGNGWDEIYAGKGSDKLYGEAGVNGFHFHENDGKDTIYMGKGVDNIYLEGITSDKAPTYERNGNNLVINYGNNDSVTVANYFRTKNPSAKSVTYDGITDDLNGSLTQTKSDDIVISGQLIKDQDWGNYYYYQGNDKNNLIYTSSKLDWVDAGNGDNTVYINSKVEAGVVGGNGNDTYRVNSLRAFTYIEDSGGTDKLVINEKANNINVIFEVNADKSPVYNNSSMLILNDSAFNKLKKNNYEIVPENITSGIEVSDADSSIEKIYSKDNKVLDVQAVQTSVANWLISKGYDSAMQVLEYEKTDGDIEALVGIYQNAWENV